ncbi:MAG: DUF3783 domain-containing protein [Tissierellia bacterium]|nr:DUF3783 domain-containing protein [Tissierellia bacterium]
MKEEKFILIYGIKGERLEILERVASDHKFGLRPIRDYELDLKVSEILENKERDFGDLGEIKGIEDFEYMLFANIHDQELYNFLEDIKGQGVYIAHKAVLTKTNVNWTLRYLINENKEEHVVMTLYGQLIKAMKVARGLLEETKDQELEGLMERAEGYMQPREFDFDELKEIYNSLALRINQLLDQRR